LTAKNTGYSSSNISFNSEIGSRAMTDEYEQKSPEGGVGSMKMNEIGAFTEF